MAARKKKSQTVPDFFERLPIHYRHLICLGFLFILPFILFYASTLGGQQYMGHDVLQWRAGAESLIEHQETHGETAHWAANMFSGMPATTISHPQQIPNIDTTLLRALSFIYPAVEFWILFGGTYLMMILMGFRPLSSVFGAVVIGFSTYIPIIIGAGHNAKFLAYIYIPWLYSGYYLITRSKINRFFAFFIFGLALTLHLRAYHPQVTYFFFFPLATLFVWDFIKAWKSEKLPAFLNKTAWLSGAAVIALLISIQLYWSTAEYSSYSMRGGSELEDRSALAIDYAFAWSQGIGELLTLAIPNSYGGSSGDAYWGPKTFTSGPHYMGALVVLFFLIGLIRSKNHFKWIFAGPGFATLLFSLGENFMLLNRAMFNYFPLFDKFRVPEMWLMVTVFCFAVVAVMGLEWTLNQIKEQLKDWKKPVAIAAGVGAVLFIIGFQFLSFEKPGERQLYAQQIAQQNQVPVDDPRVSQAVSRYMVSELIPMREEIARQDSLRFGFFFLAGIAIIWVAAGKKISASAAAGVFCVLLAFDMIQVDKRYLSESSLVEGSLERHQLIEQQERELDRYIADNSMTDEGWQYRTLPLLDNAFNNATPAYFYPSAGGYSGAKLGYYQDLIDEAKLLNRNQPNPSVMAMLNVKYVTTRTPMSIPGFSIDQNFSNGAVMINNTVLPKAWFVESVTVKDSQPDILLEISQRFNPERVAFVAEPLSTEIERDDQSSIRISHYNANEIRAEISRNAPGFMVMSEIWYPPGWTATLNGEEIDIIRTNYVLRGFEIPAGDHELILKLEPTWYNPGRWMSRIGTFLLFGSGIFGILIFARNRKSTEDHVEQN